MQARNSVQCYNLKLNSIYNASYESVDILINYSSYQVIALRKIMNLHEVFSWFLEPKLHPI